MTVTKLASSAHGPARTARGSTPGTAGESSSGQCAAAHGRPRAVCNPATAAWSERTADWPSPERTADGPSPAGSASQCSAVIVWGERSARWSIRSLRETTAADSAVQSRLSADHATAVKWSHAHAPRAHARAQTRTAGTTGIPWMFCMFCIFCMFCMHCSTRPSAGSLQPGNRSMVRTHSRLAKSRTHSRWAKSLGVGQPMLCRQRLGRTIGSVEHKIVA